MTKQYIGLDIVKFLMAMIVVSIHTNLFCESQKLKSYLLPWQKIAVPVFFIISSFLFFKKINSMKNGNDLLRKYIIRLIIFSLIWFIITLPINLFFHYYPSINLPSIIKYIFFSGLFPGSWFISALAIGIVLSYMTFRMKIGYIAFGISIVCCLVCEYNEYLPYCLQNYYNVINRFVWDLNATFLPTHIYVFIGAFLAKYTIENKYSRINAPILVLFLGVAYACQFRLGGVLSSIFMAIIVFMIGHNYNRKTNLFNKKLRQVSIVVYIVHFTFNRLYCYVLYHFHYNPQDYSFLRYVIVVVFSLSFAIFLLKLKEKVSIIKFLF